MQLNAYSWLHHNFFSIISVLSKFILTHNNKFQMNIIKMKSVRSLNSYGKKLLKIFSSFSMQFWFSFFKYCHVYHYLKFGLVFKMKTIISIVNIDSVVILIFQKLMWNDTFQQKTWEVFEIGLRSRHLFLKHYTLFWVMKKKQKDILTIIKNVLKLFFKNIMYTATEHYYTVWNFIAFKNLL